jgi:hypothetical protein
LDWCRRHVDESIDPLRQRLAMPTVRQPTWQQRISLENEFVQKLEREAADGRGAANR